MRKVLALLLPLALLLAGCSGSDDAPGPSDESSAASSGSSALAEVTVTSGEEGSAPTVEFPTPLEVTEPMIRQVSEGEGAEVEAGQTVSLRVSAYNAENGERVMETFSAAAGEELVMDESTPNVQLVDAVVGSAVGSEFAYGVPGRPAAQGGTPGPAQLLVFWVESAEETVEPEPPLEEVAGETITPPEGLPTVEINDDGVPEISIPEDAEEPTELVAQDLITGEGAEVETSDTVIAHYRGVQWSNGETFDSSWERGEPASFPLTRVIPGWTEGLAGKTIGSRVLLVIPPELGYGPEGDSGGRPGGTLVFVVDILGVE